MGAAGPQTQTYDLRDASNRGLRRMVTFYTYQLVGIYVAVSQK